MELKLSLGSKFQLASKEALPSTVEQQIFTAKFRSSGIKHTNFLQACKAYNKYGIKLTPPHSGKCYLGLLPLRQAKQMKKRGTAPRHSAHI